MIVNWTIKDSIPLVYKKMRIKEDIGTYIYQNFEKIIKGNKVEEKKVLKEII